MTVQRLSDTPPLTDYVDNFLNDIQIKEQLFRVGREGFVNKGPGVVVVDLRQFAQNVVRFYYLSAGKDNHWQDSEMATICQSYDPETEVIIFLFYGEFSPKNYSYKLALR